MNDNDREYPPEFIDALRHYIENEPKPTGLELFLKLFGIRK